MIITLNKLITIIIPRNKFTRRIIVGYVSCAVKIASGFTFPRKDGRIILNLKQPKNYDTNLLPLYESDASFKHSNSHPSKELYVRRTLHGDVRRRIHLSISGNVPRTFGGNVQSMFVSQRTKVELDADVLCTSLACRDHI